MRKKIVKKDEFESYRSYIGPKALNLKKCAEYGFNVPDFVVMPAYLCRTVFADAGLRGSLAAEAASWLKGGKFAVRSCALIEDTEKRSCAGRFKTRIDVGPAALALSLYEVLKDAHRILHGELDKFSVIIQEYIEADLAGVAFTRNPDGGREMVIEYGTGKSDNVTAGLIRPKKFSFYWNDFHIKAQLKQAGIENAVEVFKKIEKASGWPQDIEWCLAKNNFYLLQTRPITTITAKHYEQIVYLENMLPRSKNFLISKTEISEAASRPSPFTFDLLKKLYGAGGPIEKVYRKYGIKYCYSGFLKIIGNELYIDKEKELQGIMPGLKLTERKNNGFRLNIFAKPLTTVKNFIALNLIRTAVCEELFVRIKSKIEEAIQDTLDLTAALKLFLEDYELIFEINLLSSLSFKRANNSLKNESVRLPEIINGLRVFSDWRKYQSVATPRKLFGNCLEISDESDFISNKYFTNESDEKFSVWWRKLPEYKKRFWLKIINEATMYSRLRELGRWLAVKNLNIMRSALFDLAESQCFLEKRNIYYSRLSDLLENNFCETARKHSKDKFLKYNDFNLPVVIASSLIDNEAKTLGVSVGSAVGILLDQASMESRGHKNEKVILYSEILSPDLAIYFDKISGIISESGGMLSHLAILAREKSIPVVVGFSLFDNKIKMGDNVRINGGNGEIEKIL